VRPVNLIPPEDRRGDHAPLRAGIASYVVVGALLVGLLAVTMIVLTNNKIADSQAELTTLEARQAAAEQTATELAPYDEFAMLSQAREATVTSLAESRFDWERVLNELALVIPEKVSLQSLTGSVSTGTATGTASPAASPTDGSITGPSLQISGCARGQTGVARFLASLRDIDGVTRVGMQSSAVGQQSASTASTGSSGASATSGGGGCVGAKVAQFEASVAFDAVPAPTVGAPPATGTPAAATTTTADGGVAAAEATQKTAVDSASKQTQKANQGAAIIGAGN
jgi:Tfp pilus assembly protein PilN